jgi:hypothetical protein
MTLHRSVLALCGAVALCGCNTASQAPAPQAVAQVSMPQYVTRADFRLPEGSGCSSDIARFRAIMDNDLQTGNVNREVHGRVMADLRGPEAACAGGREAEARAALRTVKARYGYP